MLSRKFTELATPTYQAIVTGITTALGPAKTVAEAPSSGAATIQQAARVWITSLAGGESGRASSTRPRRNTARQPTRRSGLIV